jgi:hypothetical protein
MEAEQGHQGGPELARFTELVKIFVEPLLKRV